MVYTEGKHNGVVEREVYRLKGSTMERWEGQCTEGKHNGAVGSVVKGGRSTFCIGIFIAPGCYVLYLLLKLICVFYGLFYGSVVILHSHAGLSHCLHC